MENPDRQSYNKHLALKKSKLHLNYMTVDYLNLDHFDKLVKSKLKKFATYLAFFIGLPPGVNITQI